jgi:hypothetical protein
LFREGQEPFPDAPLAKARLIVRISSLIDAKRRLLVFCTSRAVRVTRRIVQDTTFNDLSTSRNVRESRRFGRDTSRNVSDPLLSVPETPFFEYKRRLLAIKHRLR